MNSHCLSIKGSLKSRQVSLSFYPVCCLVIKDCHSFIIVDQHELRVKSIPQADRRSRHDDSLDDVSGRGSEGRRGGCNRNRQRRRMLEMSSFDGQSSRNFNNNVKRSVESSLSSDAKTLSIITFCLFVTYYLFFHFFQFLFVTRRFELS